MPTRPLRFIQLASAGVIAALLTLGLAACGSPDPTPTSAPTATPPPGATPTSTPTEEELFEQQWQELIAQAQEEGEVVAGFATGGGATFRPLLDIFEQEFGVKAIIPPGGRGSEVADRVLAEQSAGRYLVDAWTSGASTGARMAAAGALDPVRDWLVRPEVLDESRWVGDRLYFIDPTQEFLLAYAVRFNPPYAIVNTDLVDPDSIKTHDDVLDPQWKGMIVVGEDPALGNISSSTLARYYPSEAGREYLRRLYSDMDPVLVDSIRLFLDGLARGVYALGQLPGQGGGMDAAVATLAQIGLPIAYVELDGFGEWTVGATNNLGVVKNPPNPSAATLLVNWLLSEEGWDARVRTIRENPDLPIGYTAAVPLVKSWSTDHLPPEQLIPEVGFYLPAADPTYVETTAEARDWFKQMGEAAGWR